MRSQRTGPLQQLASNCLAWAGSDKERDHAIQMHDGLALSPGNSAHHLVSGGVCEKFCFFTNWLPWGVYNNPAVLV